MLATNTWQNWTSCMGISRMSREYVSKRRRWSTRFLSYDGPVSLLNEVNGISMTNVDNKRRQLKTLVNKSITLLLLSINVLSVQILQHATQRVLLVVLFHYSHLIHSNNELLSVVEGESSHSHIQNVFPRLYMQVNTHSLTQNTSYLAYRGVCATRSSTAWCTDQCSIQWIRQGNSFQIVPMNNR